MTVIDAPLLERAAPLGHRGQEEAPAGGEGVSRPCPTDGTGLRFLRAVAGLVAAVTCARALVHGWIDTLWVTPPGRLPYPNLGWVPVPPRGVLVALVVVCGLAGAAVVLGVAERALLGTVAVGMSWLGALDAAAYLNHEVLLVALAALVALLPTGRAVPRWAVALPRVLVGSVYLWAAVAKLDPGWLEGRPLLVWLGARGDVPLVGSLLVRPPAAPLLAWASLVFEVLVVPALAWRRTRTGALAAVVAFHGATALLFPLGVFPWLMAGVAVGAFAPRWLPWVPRLGAWSPPSSSPPPPEAPGRVARRIVATAIVAVCVLAPVRAVLPGSDPAYDGTGDHLAWRVMDHARSGFVTWLVTDRATGASWEEPAGERLAPHQVRQLGATVSLLPEAARQVRRAWAREGLDVEVRAEVLLSVDGGRAVQVVDPTVDLSRVGWGPGHPRWARSGRATGPSVTGA